MSRWPDISSTTKNGRKFFRLGLGICLITSIFLNLNLRSGISTAIIHANMTTGYFGCDEIAKLEIVRLIGAGSQKSAYEVKLPWGEHAIAKQCRQESCIKKLWLEKEANLTRELYEEYGDQVVRYFGECNAAYNGTSTTVLKTQRRDFSIGFTSVVELGNPMYRGRMNDTQCFAEFYTETDIEDFKNIARLFANFSKSPVILRTKQKNDNIYPQQYMTSIGESSEGRIKLLDLDFQTTCKIGEALSKRRICTFDTVLDANCKIMAELTNIPNLNCLLPVSSNSSNRINASHAAKECEK